MIPFPRRGLYAITPDREYASGELETAVRHAIDGGAVAIQYRSKQPDARRHLEAAALAGICRECSVPLIINDDVALAAEIEAGGAHVGKDDLDLKTARSMLGSAATIGVSCYASAARAGAAAEAGADYVAFGSFYPSRTKPEAPPCPLSVLESARGALSVPIVAIGGITEANGAALIAAGADFLAVIEDVFGHRDIRAAATRLARLFD